MEHVIYNANGGFDLFIIIGILFAYATIRKLASVWDKFFVGSSIESIHASINSEKMVVFIIMVGSVIYPETRMVAVVCAILAYFTASMMNASKQ